MFQQLHDMTILDSFSDWIQAHGEGNLLGQADAAEQILESGVATQRVEDRVHLQDGENWRMLLVSFLQPG